MHTITKTNKTGIFIRDNKVLDKLNSAKWKEIISNKEGVGTSKLTPANVAMAKSLDLPYLAKYAESGFCSESVKIPLDPKIGSRLSNLWHGEFITEEKTVKLDYLRSSSLIHFGEESEQLRSQVTSNNINELLSVAHALTKSRGIDTTKIRFVNIDLQSPQGLVDGTDIEKLTIREQREALAEFSNKTIFVNNEETKFDIKSINATSYEMSYRDSDGWAFSLEQKMDLLNILKESFNSLSNERKKIFKKTFSNALELVRADSDLTTPAERFAQLSRIAVIAIESGAIVHFNCRSGKDRTGYLDAEIKFLAYQIERENQGLETSQPASAVLEEEMDGWKLALLDSGNPDIQKLNTGKTGSKLDRGDLKERVGQKLWKGFIGNGREVSA